MTKILRRMLGSIIYGLAKAQSFLLGGLVSLLETGVLLAKSFIRSCAVIISMGGCLVLFLLVGPLGAWLFSHPGLFTGLLVLIFFPVLGAAFSTALSAYRKISTAYLFNLANYLKDSAKFTYRTYDYYRQAARQAEEAAAWQEQERRRQQQRAWEERFRQWHQQGWQQQQQQRTGAPPLNPYADFKRKFEQSCQILGVATDADQNKIKLAYRRQAKRYHPDINKDPQATRQFQAINEAYEFLNEENIRRYQNLPPV